MSTWNNSQIIKVINKMLISKRKFPKWGMKPYFNIKIYVPTFQYTF